VIRIDQAKKFDVVYGRVSKLEFHLTHPERLDNCSMRDATQCHHNRIVGQCLQLVRKIRVAGVDLGADGLVFRWLALRRVRGAAIDEFQTIICGFGMIATGESVFMHFLIEQNPRVIPGKRTPGPVRTMHTRGKADDKKSRIAAAERRNGPAVVIGITFVYVIQKRRKSGTLTAVFVEQCVADQERQSSMWRMIASPNPRVPTSLAPGTIWSSSCSTSSLPCGLSLRFG
jgi:hypothetical protein